MNNNIFNDMGIGLPSGLNKKDKQRLVNITNNSLNNNDSIKTLIINSINNKTDNKLALTSSWDTVNQAIQNLYGSNQEITDDNLELIVDRYLPIASDVPNIKFIDSNNNFITQDNKLYDYNTKATIKDFGKDGLRCDCIDKDDNYYMIDFKDYSIKTDTTHSDNRYKIVTFSFAYKKFNKDTTIIDKTISFDVTHGGTFCEPYYGGTYTIEYALTTHPPTILNVITTTNNIYVFLQFGASYASGSFDTIAGVALDIIKFDLNGNFIEEIFTRLADQSGVQWNNNLNLVKSYSKYICFQLNIHYPSTSHCKFYVISENNKMYSKSGSNGYGEGYLNTTEVYFKDNSIYTLDFNPISTVNTQMYRNLNKIDLDDTKSGSSDGSTISVIETQIFSLIDIIDAPFIVDDKNNIILISSSKIYHFDIINSIIDRVLSGSFGSLFGYDKNGDILSPPYKLSTKIVYKIKDLNKGGE